MRAPIRLHAYPWRNLRVVAKVLGEGVHAFLCSVLAGIGIVFLLPGSTFLASPAWRIAAEAASEEVWGWRYLLTAAFGLTAFLTPRFWWRMVCTWLVASAHLATAVMLVLAQPLTTGTSVYSLIALAGYGLVSLMAWDMTR